jgi:beta-fructofuranosidase
MKILFIAAILYLLPPFIFGQNSYNLFYTPKNGYSGDFIPFYEKGEFRLFYLQDWRDKEKFGEGTPWYQISTKDFLSFTEYGEMLPRGTKDEQDLYVYTGSVIKSEGKYHIFYTGHNQYFVEKKKPQEAIMHAVSTDLIHWEKIPKDTFYAPKGIFEQDDWRDPFVFWNEEAQEYEMLVCARLHNNVSFQHRGCTAICTSKDLSKWEVKEKPLYSPGLYNTQECPDLFKMGNWWYLLTSISNWRFGTQYVMSRSLNGPWITPENNFFDDKEFYAAKSYSDGVHRYLFGWNSTKQHQSDYRSFEWGGSLIVHEIIQNSDGTLSVRVPESIDKSFTKEIPSKFTPLEGKWEINEKTIHADAAGECASALADSMPSCCRISAKVTFSKGTKECGLILRASKDIEKCYNVRLEPSKNRVIFNLEPHGNSPLTLERPVDLQPDVPHEIKVFTDHSNCVIYVDGKTAISARMYNIDDGKWGLYVIQGSADFSDMQIRVRE